MLIDVDSFVTKGDDPGTSRVLYPRDVTDSLVDGHDNTPTDDFTLGESIQRQDLIAHSGAEDIPDYIFENVLEKRSLSKSFHIHECRDRAFAQLNSNSPRFAPVGR